MLRLPALATTLAIALIVATLATAEAAFVEVVPENLNGQRTRVGAYFFEPKCHVRMRGFINEQTVDSLREIKRKHSGELSRVAPVVLCLHSPGGDLEAALKLKREVENWITVVDSGDICLSACAILFMGGGKIHKAPDGDRWRQERVRFLHFTGRLGFHAPSLVFVNRRDSRTTDAAGGRDGAGARDTFSRDDVSNAYLRMQITMRELLFPDLARRPAGDRPFDAMGAAIRARLQRNLIEAYDRDFIPESLLFSFLFTPSNEMRFVETVEDAARWGIELFGYDKKPKDIPEYMLWNVCFNSVLRRCGLGEASCRDNDFYSLDFKWARSTIPLLEHYRRRYGIYKPKPLSEPPGMSRLPDLTRSAHEIDIGPEATGCRLYKFDQAGLRAIVSDAGQGSLENKTELWNAAASDNWDADALGGSNAGRRLSQRLALLARTWMWLPPDTRIADAALELDRLMVLAPEEAERERRNEYRTVRLCNITKAPMIAAFGFNLEDKSGRITDGWYEIAPFACTIRNIPASARTVHYFAMRTQGGKTFPPNVPDGVSEPGCVDFRYRFEITGADCAGGRSEVRFEPIELSRLITSAIMMDDDDNIDDKFVEEALRKRAGSVLMGDLGLASPPLPDAQTIAQLKPSGPMPARPTLCNALDKPIYAALGRTSVMSFILAGVTRMFHTGKWDPFEAILEGSGVEVTVDGWYRLEARSCMYITKFRAESIFLRAVDEDGTVLTQREASPLCVEAAAFTFTQPTSMMDQGNDDEKSCQRKLDRPNANLVRFESFSSDQIVISAAGAAQQQLPPPAARRAGARVDLPPTAVGK